MLARIVWSHVQSCQAIVPTSPLLAQRLPLKPLALDQRRLYPHQQHGCIWKAIVVPHSWVKLNTAQTIYDVLRRHHSFIHRTLRSTSSLYIFSFFQPLFELLNFIVTSIFGFEVYFHPISFNRQDALFHCFCLACLGFFSFCDNSSPTH